MRNLSPNREWFKVKKHLESIAHKYREAKTAEEKALHASELEQYGALNINNNSGRWVIVF